MMSVTEFFADHTYRMVFFGTSLIGLSAGALGSFAYLRKQSLMSDVISHAALPGALIAFIVSVGALGIDGRNMVALTIGAVVVGTLAVAFSHAIAAFSKVAIDTAMAISLTVFFGAGMLLIHVIGKRPMPGKGGIKDYLFGNASTMTQADLRTIAVVAAIALLVTVVFFKEFELRTFDPAHAIVLGFGAKTVDTIMFATIVPATVIGLKAVGLVLMVAFVVTPPAAARQWTRRLPTMVVLSAMVGAAGSGIGAYISISSGSLPTGPVIVLVLFAIFLISLLFAPRRSLIAAACRQASARSRLKAELLAERSRP